AAQHGAGYFRVHPPRRPGQPGRAPLAGRHDALGDDGGRLGELAVVEHVAAGHRLQADLDVDPVEQRPGDPGEIAAAGGRGAGAAAYALSAALRARARVSREYEREPGGEDGLGAGPGDDHLARLKRLTQRVEDVAVEFRGFVKEEDSPVR